MAASQWSLSGTTDRFVCLEASSLLTAIITYSFRRYASQAHISGESSAACYMHIEEDTIILFRSFPEEALMKESVMNLRAKPYFLIHVELKLGTLLHP